MARQRIQGNDLMLFDAEGKSLAFATSHSLNMDVEMNEINDKDAGAFGTQMPGKVTWSISSDNIYSTEQYDTLSDILLNKTKVKVYFGLKSGYEGSASFDPNAVVNDGTTDGNWTPDSTSYVSYGYCYLNSLAVNAASGDRATFTANFTGVGPIQRATYSVASA